MAAPSTVARAPAFLSLSVIDCAKQTARGRLAMGGKLAVSQNGQADT